MLRKEYSALCGRLRSREDVAREAASGAHSYDTLLALYVQAYVRQMIRTSHVLRKRSAELAARFGAGEPLLDLAEEVNMSPCMVARQVLQERLGTSRATVTKMLRNPAREIGDPRVRAEVLSCIESDEHGGPFMDRERAAVGLEYEFVLAEKLRNIGLEYETEKDLRRRGCHKTPDFLLAVPVAFDGHVVRWIDSKAKFGDEYFMGKDYTDSVSSYVGRYGPGMVVYWFGFVEDCDSPMVTDTGVYVADCLPTDVLLLPGTLESDSNVQSDEELSLATEKISMEEAQS